MPFSLGMVRDNKENTNVNCGENQDLCGKTGLDVLEVLVNKAADRGLLIMLDYHHMRAHDGMNELWSDGEFPEGEVFNLWRRVLDRLGNKWNVFALDLKNEPHGQASWGWKNEATDWNWAAERFIRELAPNFPNLFFVQGVEANAASPHENQQAHWWGGNLEGVEWNPIRTGNDELDRRVVYSPHVYGPDVHNQDYFQVGDFPHNMPAIWDQHFGRAQEITGQPVVIGEWGGKFNEGSPDETWQNKLADYLIEKCLTDQFYWCFNPNSGDTQGFLFDDWRTHNERKAVMLWRVVPNPTKFWQKDGQICVEPGSYANGGCNN